MSCFYCGKRVSLVRKRTDADFCSDEHREKYNARTRRTMEVLARDEERMTVTRKLTDGFSVSAPAPCHGVDLDDLVLRSPGKPAHFAAVPTGLPTSRASVDIYMPSAVNVSLRLLCRDGEVPPPRVERPLWSFGRAQGDPRPPVPFAVLIVPPQTGMIRIGVKQAACDRPRSVDLAPPVQFSALARVSPPPRSARRPAAHSMGVLRRAVRPPGPVAPPPPPPPIVVTLRHPSLAINLGRRRASAISIRLPQPGLVGIGYAPTGAAARPPDLACLRIVRRALAMPSVSIGAAALVRFRDSKGVQRLIPCPDGFRRKQYYSWEVPERFLALAFRSVAGRRSAIRIASTPDRAPGMGLGAWAVPVDDGQTAQSERRRPAPPFREHLELPAAMRVVAPAALREAPGSRAPAVGRDSIEHLPQASLWQDFPAAPLSRGRSAPGRFSRGWFSSTAEAVPAASWLRPHAHASKRTVCQIGFAIRTPVFTGPAFFAGSRQAGPTPERFQPPPRFEPRAVPARGERVDPRPRPLLPALSRPLAALSGTSLLPDGCRLPVGHASAVATVHPAYPILFGAVLPAGHLGASAVSGLHARPPVRRTGARFDIDKAKPALVDREPLVRFLRHAREALRSLPAAPRWPTPSASALLDSPVATPCPHPSREPELESAVPMLCEFARPAAGALLRSCILTDCGAAPSVLPLGADWGNLSRPDTAPLTLAPVLPGDPHGPVRDWGLAPPPEPEKLPEPIHEDFAGGLANWICSNNDWRQDIAGVRTGSLALLRPSLSMRDYEFEFLGKIENQAIGCVFRAANAANYHAAQIAFDNATGELRLVRFSVIAGGREPSVDQPLPIAVARSASCRVKLSVRGNDFKVFLNDQPAGAWSDDRLPEGGIGFFSDPDDRARLYWVKVTPYQDGADDGFNLPMVPPQSGIRREIRMGV